MNAAYMALVLLVGCPEEPPDMVQQLAQQPQNQGQHQGQDQGQDQGEPSSEPGPPSEGTAGDAPRAGDAPAPGELPAFELGEATITVRGRVVGADAGQVDFLVIEETDGVQRPRVLHVAQLTAGAFEVTAPATYEDPIYLSVLVDETGDGPDPTDPEGGLEEPITLAGSDVTVELTLDNVPDWLSTLHDAAKGADDDADDDGADDAAEVP